jgi:hypothetical protein
MLMSIKVSASGQVRDQLRLAARGYLGDGVSMAELDYQPGR